MNIGLVMCLFMGGLFLLLAVLFTLLGARGSMLVSGFNTLPKAERACYDHKRLAADHRNLFWIWAAVMAAGALFCWIFSP